MSVRCISWVYEQRVGDHIAKAVLAKLADNANDAGVAWPSVRLLAEQTEIPERTVKRKLAWLADAGWISKQQTRNGSGGSWGGNVYRLHLELTGATVAHGTGATSGPDGGHCERARGGVPSLNQPSPLQPSGERGREARQIKTKISGKIATTGEIRHAEAVLAAWNETTRQQLTAESWLALIIRRHREHPELSVDEFVEIVDAVLAAPWWEGPPSLNLIFGNDMQFERCMTVARADESAVGHGNGQRSNGKRYGVGVTTSQLRDHFSKR